jgi:hypothetical protein
MARVVFCLSLLFILCPVFSQQITHEVRVVNIAVPVRVFDGDKFVDSLKLKDLSSDPQRAAELAAILAKSAAYCRRLENAALNFVCLEDVIERLVGSGRFFVNTMAFALGHRSIEWIYDYQLIRSNGQTQEKRTLIKENGVGRNEADAELKTSRFVHRNVFLGPIGLLSESAQSRHKYEFVKEGKVGGEPAIVIRATPIVEKAGYLFGKAWVRKQDGAVLRIEWEPVSMENYDAIEKFSHLINRQAKISFVSEYIFEKNGLFFPNLYEVTEEYIGINLDWGNVVSRTIVTYKDYRFFQVETAVDIR